jgi:kynureninase
MHMDDVMRRKMSTAYNKFQDIFQMVKTLEESMDTLIHNLESFSLLFQLASRTRQ